MIWFEWQNFFHTYSTTLLCFLLTWDASWFALFCCSCLFACHTFLSFFLLVYVSACLSLGSDSAQKVGLQPCHVSLWLQGQYQTCPWRWQCKYCWNWKQILVRVDAYHILCKFSLIWAVLLKIVIKRESLFSHLAATKRPDWSLREEFVFLVYEFGSPWLDAYYITYTWLGCVYTETDIVLKPSSHRYDLYLTVIKGKVGPSFFILHPFVKQSWEEIILIGRNQVPLT